ncbi:hypothetical protein [Pseudomonas sp. NPDC087615]|uniref:hypothetical protein n=1 Tax=Pseudomonas sp. NPDC087615 TaxID=3364443 RepID=UPI0037F38BEB
MIKPTKKVSVTTTGSGTTSTTSTTTRSVDYLSGNRGTSHLPDVYLPGIGSTSAQHSSNISQGSTTRAPSVTVSKMPDAGLDTYGTARSEIAWPQSRFNELIPLADNTGLFTGPDLRTYAQIGTEGQFVVEQNRQGKYYVPLSFAPGVPGPILTKTQGQASWRIEQPGWQLTQTPSAEAVKLQTPSYLSPDNAAKLSKAELSAQGIRYNKLKQTYVDTVEGTVMVRQNADGDYQQAFAATSDSPAIFFEQIPGTKLWRRKAQSTTTDESGAPDNPRPVAERDEPTPGPSKRARLNEPEDSIPPTNDNNASSVQTPYFWLPWGNLYPPSSVDSIQLGWLHYPIVPIGSAPNSLPKVYFLQHPEFAPAHFDAFEHMLQTNPERQPVATFRIGTEPGEIRPGKRFFEKPLSQSVADTFPDFSDFTSRAVARKLFELSDNSPAITGTGLINIQAVLHQWNQKPFPAAPAYADPMNMLPVVTSVDIGNKRILPLRPQGDGDLQRLTFDPTHFPVEWHHYLTYPSDLNLRRLVGALLVRSGYDIFPLTYEHRSPTLVFRRTNHQEVFYLKLGTVGDPGLSHPPGNELSDPNLPQRIGSAALLALQSAEAQNKVVWLVGGVAKVASNPVAVVIIRER